MNHYSTKKMLCGNNVFNYFIVLDRISSLPRAQRELLV